MSLNAALLILSVATAFAFISAQSTCRNTVLCSCGSTAKTFTVCAEQNTTAADPCTRWPGCKTCHGGSENPSCVTAMNQILKSRRKRHYASYGREERRSYPAKRVRWARQSTGDCSENIENPKLGSIRCTFGRGRKTCTGTCLPGYTFQGMHEEEMVLSCSHGHWTPSRSFPPCVSGGHCDLVVNGHGRFNCTTGMQGTRCDVFCSSRYAGRFHCYPGRPWEPTLPRCVRPEGGESDIDDHCHCEHGASCDDHDHCICPAGRTGTHCESTVPVVTCPDPGRVANADRLNTDGSPSLGVQRYRAGQSVAYTCREGYALQRRSLITCQTSGSWSDSLPHCRPIRIRETVILSTTTAIPVVTCPDPGQVANANRLNTDGSPSLGVQRYRAGQSVAYTCREGYALQRRSLITCQTSGSWSDSLPRCRPIRVRETVIPSTTTARPEERGGLVYCRDPGRVMNGNRVPVAAPSQRGFSQGSSLEYSCNQGFTLQGVGTIFCLLSGRWSSAVPRCEVQQSGGDGEFCFNPGSIQNGKITYYPNKNIQIGSEVSLDDPYYPSNSRLVYSCNEGYQLQGASERTCRGDTDQWSTEAPICVEGTSILYCENLGPLANGQRVHFSSINSRTGSSEGNTEDPEYPEGTRFEYSCNAGYTMTGRRSQTCEKGYWSTPKPTCEITLSRNMMYCDNPGPIINGRIQRIPPTAESSISEDDIEYPEGTQLQYSCDDEFVLLGPNSISCLSTSLWSSEPPICSAGCGLSPALSSIRIFNGTKSRAGEWPWVVSIKENRDSEIVCGGAVLSSRTVVTAAHCLTGSDSYILYFGKIHKLDQDDDDKVVVRTSTRIILHPDYSDQTMDSDIGLIYFSNRIRFTDRIQPICLPDTSSTAKNLRAKRKGYVAGFGENELGVQPDDLMQARIPVQDNKVCVEYYKEQGISLIMTRNMFCAGYAGGEQATCQGDSGSALVFFDPSTERFTLEGLVSFATNGQCGLYGRYIVFTRVFPYVSWLLANLN